jgi:hypothetical protein
MEAKETMPVMETLPTEILLDIFGHLCFHC